MLCFPVRTGLETLGVQLCAHCMKNREVHAPDRDAWKSVGQQRFRGAQLLVCEIENAAKRSAEAQGHGAGGWAETPSRRGVSGRYTMAA